MDISTLLIAPIEKRNTVDSSKKFKVTMKRLGRAIKHLADLNLQTDLLQDAYNCYRVAINILRYHKDWLWLGGNF